MFRRLAIPSLALLLALAGASQTHGVDRVSALGSDGALYTLRVGSFPELTGTDDSVLVLEVRRSGGELFRDLVPMEGTPSPFGLPSLFIDFVTDAVSIVGEFHPGSPHSRLNLVTYQDGVWSDVIEISGRAFSAKGSPQLIVTHDHFSTELEGDDEDRSYVRQVLHTIWWEETGAGIQAFYTPLIVLDGEYIGWNPVYALADLLPTASDGGATVAESLLRNPTIVPGRDGSSVALAAADAASGRLWSFEMHVVDGHWSLLAAAAEAFVLESGGPLAEEGFGKLADKARSHIIEIGNRLPLHPGKVAFAAAALADEIVAVGSEEGSIDRLAERARSHIIELGAGFAPAPERQRMDKARSHIIEIGNRPPDPATGNTGLLHVLTLSSVESWPAPTIGGTSEQPTLIVSDKGGRLLVAWDAPSSVRYRETNDGEWSPFLELRLDDLLTREAAYNILRQRIRNR